MSKVHSGEIDEIYTIDYKLPKFKDEFAELEDLLPTGIPTIKLPQELAGSYFGVGTLNILNINNYRAAIDLSDRRAILPKIRNINFWRNSKLTKIKVDGLTTLETLTVDDSEPIEEIILDGCFHLSTVNLFDINFATNNQLRLFSAVNCKSLVNIDLDGFAKLEKVDLQSCFKLSRLNLIQSPNIRDLNLYQCRELKDEELELPSNLNFLRNINLSQCEGLKDKAVKIIQLATQAKVINIGGCGRLTDEDFQQMFLQHHDQLEELTLPQHLATDLTELNFEGCTSLKKLSFDIDSQNPQFTRLKTLNLAGTKLSAGQIINIVKSASDLEVLDLTGCNIDDAEIGEILEAIPNKDKLRILKLGNIDGLKIFPTQLIQDFSNLEEISFAQSGLESLAGDAIKLKKLAKIDLSGCPIPNENIENFISEAADLDVLVISGSGDDIDIAALTKDRNIRELRVSDYQGTSLRLDNIGGLRVLDLSNSEKLQNLSTSPLPFLQELSLANSKLLTPSAIGRIVPTDSNNIAKIDLSCAKLSDKELESIFKKLTKLTDLEISNLELKPRGKDNYLLTIPNALGGLKRVNLSESNITSLSVLGGVQELEEINCSNCKSLKTISALGLKALRTVNLQGCEELSSSGIIRLMKDSLPQIEVINIIGCNGITIDHIRGIFASAQNLEQIYVDKDLEKQIYDEVRHGRLKLPDKLLILSSNFDQEKSSDLRESKVESPEIQELKSQIAMLSRRVETLESSSHSTILAGEEVEQALAERQHLEDDMLYTNLKLQLSALFKISQLSSTSNLLITNLVDKDTATTAIGTAISLIPYVGRTTAADFYEAKFKASGESDRLKKLYLISGEETSIPLIDYLARKLVSDKDVIDDLDYLANNPIIDEIPNKKLTKFQKKSDQALGNAIKTLKDKAEQSDNPKTKAACEYSIYALNKIKDMLSKPQDLPNRFNNSRYTQSSQVSNLMVSIMSAVFSSQDIGPESKIDNAMAEKLVTSIKQDLRAKCESQKKKEEENQQQQERTAGRSRIATRGTGGRSQ